MWRYFLLVIFSMVMVGCNTPQKAFYMSEAPLQERLKQKGVRHGDPVFVRVFKEEKVLEIWIKKGDKYVPFTNYPICYYSGPLGPKKYQGDKVSPEGFYRITQSALNPRSQYRKSFNLGFPNQYDRFKGYTGDYLMVHGDCVSVGCYAMTDLQIDEIYALVESALKGKSQSVVEIHIFPFRMTNKRLEREKNSPHYAFWMELKEGYDYFEKNKRVPTITVEGGRYIIR